jgi:hypothetical protein
MFDLSDSSAVVPNAVTCTLVQEPTGVPCEAGYRATLQNAATGECRYFADLESLFDYLAAPAVGKEVTPDRRSEPTAEN